MCSYAVTNPTGGAANVRGTGQPDPNARLLEEVLSMDNLTSAWKQVRANKGAPGIDGVTIDEFPDRTRDHWKEILQSLLDGTYHPNPVKRVEIPKASGGTRPLGIPSVLDRLIQQAIAQVLNPIWSEKSFAKFKDRLRGLTGRSWFVSMEHRYKKLAEHPSRGY